MIDDDLQPAPREHTPGDQAPPGYDPADDGLPTLDWLEKYVPYRPFDVEL